jgi:hypothetical protein
MGMPKAQVLEPLAFSTEWGGFSAYWNRLPS